MLHTVISLNPSSGIRPIIIIRWRVLNTYLAMLTRWSAFPVLGLIAIRRSSIGVTITPDPCPLIRSINTSCFSRASCKSNKQFWEHFSMCSLPAMGLYWSRRRDVSSRIDRTWNIHKHLAMWESFKNNTISRCCCWETPPPAERNLDFFFYLHYIPEIS